jgi:EAL domain-containing protein (putative c-di-GMP-specific phosphodiesterase class I)
LGGIGQAWGLLLVSADHDASPTDVTNALSVAIDFAGVASSLLEEGLENRRRAEASRLGLATVLLQEAFVPHFQPIVNLDDNRSVGFEALTRFADGTPPDRRFAEATAMGLGLQLERATMASAVMAAESLPKHRWLSLNVSHGMLLATDLVREVIGETTRDIILEVSAQDAAADYESLRLALDQLGVEVLVALDDVTSRLAEFRRLLMLRPAFIKLDRTWVYRVDQDPARQAVILALRDLATRMDSRLIAVGVETESERDTLAGFGVHLGQGFLLGKPEPAP